MIRVIQYSILLTLGLLVSQIFEDRTWKIWNNHLMVICLAYIMIGVGEKFQLDRTKLKSYGKDYLVAMTAATLPWIFCAIYFVYVFALPWIEALIISRFAAPTSAGILLTMLGAAGLGSTWVFKKVRILAIFDDLDTILFMIPLQAILIGFQWELVLILSLTIAMLIGAYRYLHAFKLPNSKLWLLLYGMILWGICWLFEYFTHLHFEILLPSFCLGCVLISSYPSKVTSFDLDYWIKAVFMFLVGSSLANIAWEGQIIMILINVLIITIISNLGKCFPLFCYRDEATLKERLAVSISLFPRGEVGGGILAFSMAYQLHDIATTISGISLALNLLLTGVFIYTVKRILATQAITQ
jgi:Kef-type K+ transport system membrane component KefB